MRSECDLVIFQASLIGPGLMDPGSLTKSMNPWRKDTVVLPLEQEKAKQENEQRRGLQVLGKYLGSLVKRK